MPQQTVAAAVQLLTKNRIGATPVVDEQGRVVEIVSERDIIRGRSEYAGSLLTLSVDQLMTREVRTCEPRGSSSRPDAGDDAPAHPTLAGSPQPSTFAGIVGIGDVVKQRLEEVQSEVEDL